SPARPARPACLARPEYRVAISQIRPDGVRRALIDWHEPLLAPLAEHTHHPSIEVQIVEIEADQLAQAKARGVEHLEDGLVTAPERGSLIRRLQQAVHLLDGQVRRQRLLALGRRRERGRVLIDEAFPAKPARERADRRELSRGARA